MASKDDQADTRPSSVDETLDRLSKRSKQLTPNRQQALNDYLAESKANDSGKEGCKLINEWSDGLEEIDDSEIDWSDEGA